MRSELPRVSVTSHCCQSAVRGQGADIHAATWRQEVFPSFLILES